MVPGRDRESVPGSGTGKRTRARRGCRRRSGKGKHEFGDIKRDTGAAADTDGMYRHLAGSDSFYVLARLEAVTVHKDGSISGGYVCDFMANPDKAKEDDHG